MNVNKVKLDGSISSIFQLQGIYLPKIMNTANGRIFVIGGSKDLKITETLKKCVELKKDQGSDKYNMIERAEMNHPRASFGCCISKDQTKIYCLGGYITDSRVSKECEVYDIPSNKWTVLPSLLKESCSSGISEFKNQDKHLLYSFAGLYREPNTEVTLLNTVERLNLSDQNKGWEILKVTTPLTMCDVGAFQMSDKHLLVFGGWSVKGLDKVYTFDCTGEEGFKELPNGLAKSDFFLSNGAVSRN